MAAPTSAVEEPLSLISATAAAPAKPADTATAPSNAVPVSESLRDASTVTLFFAVTVAPPTISALASVSTLAISTDAPRDPVVIPPAVTAAPPAVIVMVVLSVPFTSTEPADLIFPPLISAVVPCVAAEPLIALLTVEELLLPQLLRSPVAEPLALCAAVFDELAFPPTPVTAD